MIDFDHNFVLIDTVYTPESGAILEEISPANENAATLKVSPEKQPPFIIADILKGTPRVGDRVMLGKQAQPQPAPGEKPAANGTTPANEKPVATQPSP